MGPTPGIERALHLPGISTGRCCALHEIALRGLRECLSWASRAQFSERVSAVVEYISRVANDFVPRNDVASGLDSGKEPSNAMHVATMCMRAIVTRDDAGCIR